MIVSTPYQVTQEGATITIYFAADGTKAMSFVCESEKEAYECCEMWGALIHNASEDPANNPEDEEDEDDEN